MKDGYYFRVRFNPYYELSAVWKSLMWRKSRPMKNINKDE